MEAEGELAGALAALQHRRLAKPRRAPFRDAIIQQCRSIVEDF
jgi:hypothetical protein